MNEKVVITVKNRKMGNSFAKFGFGKFDAGKFDAGKSLVDMTTENMTKEQIIDALTAMCYGLKVTSVEELIKVSKDPKFRGKFGLFVSDKGSWDDAVSLIKSKKGAGCDDNLDRLFWKNLNTSLEKLEIND